MSPNPVSSEPTPHTLTPESCPGVGCTKSKKDIYSGVGNLDIHIGVGKLDIHLGVGIAVLEVDFPQEVVSRGAERPPPQYNLVRSRPYVVPVEFTV